VTLLERRLEWQRLQGSNSTTELRIVVLSSFTVDPLVPYLGTAFADDGIRVHIEVGPYGQIASSASIRTARLRRAVLTWSSCGPGSKISGRHDRGRWTSRQMTTSAIFS